MSHREAHRGHTRAPARALAEIQAKVRIELGLTARVFTTGTWACGACGAVAASEGLCDCVAVQRAAILSPGS